MTHKPPSIVLRSVTLAHTLAFLLLYLILFAVASVFAYAERLFSKLTEWTAFGAYFAANALASSRAYFERILL